jgi:hypothetical protein
MADDVGPPDPIVEHAASDANAAPAPAARTSFLNEALKTSGYKRGFPVG